MEIQHQADQVTVRGGGGSLCVHREDEVGWKFLMLVEGECGHESVETVVARYGYCKQRYYQLRDAFQTGGVHALQSQPRGPKRNYRRGGEATRQIIRYRYLDQDAPVEIIGQKLRQTGLAISDRSVYRVFEEYGLQKKSSSRVGRRSK